MTVIIEPEPILAGAFTEALGAGVTVLDDAALLEEHLQRHSHEYAVVLGPSVPDEVAATIARHNRIQRPALGVIQVLPNVDQRVLGNALRSGMREVVEISDLSELNAAVLRCHGVARAMMETVEQMAGPVAVQQGSVVTVFSTKGGVGKSTVATNLAVSYADEGRRVCIVDLDIHSGDVAIMLQVTPLHTLADLSQLSGSIDASGVESLLSEHSTNLSVLAAPVQIGSHVPADVIESVLQILKGMFDVVVVDTSGSFDDYALPALDLSDVLVLVGTLDIPALKSLKLAAGTLDLLNLPRSRWHLLLNRADARVGLSAQEFVETLGVDVAASLPSSRDVLAAVNRGEAIVRANPGHPISKTLASFAASLLAATQAASEAEDAPADEGPRRRGVARRGLRMRKVN
jgi:pilus assembly protein CpaE